jgi:hypothetical protein
MSERRTVVLTGGPILVLVPHLVLAEQIARHDELGDCSICRGTGTVVILMCLAGEPHTPVKACPPCAGTGWLDQVERTPHVPPVQHHLPTLIEGASPCFSRSP